MEQDMDGIAAEAIQHFEDCFKDIDKSHGVADMTKDQLIECADAFRFIRNYAKDWELSLREAAEFCTW